MAIKMQFYFLNLFSYWPRCSGGSQNGRADCRPEEEILGARVSLCYRGQKPNRGLIRAPLSLSCSAFILGVGLLRSGQDRRL